MGEEKKKSFTAAMKEYFGLQPGQSIMDFGKEVAKLSYEEKVEFCEMLRSIGVNCSDPIKK